MKQITQDEFNNQDVKKLFTRDTRYECKKYFTWDGINVGYLPWIMAGYRICENRMQEKIEIACNKYPDLRELFEQP